MREPLRGCVGTHTMTVKAGEGKEGTERSTQRMLSGAVAA